MKMTLQRAKGTRDFLPEQKIVRQYIIDTLREVFELYGYSPLETPVLERYETLSSKYAGGSEILKEVFKLKDQGNRELALRYDLTVPFSRVIAMNPQLKMPFKRYQTGPVFRDGPISTGRVREFWQCDVDIVGIKKMTADAEILSLADMAYKRLGLKVKIKINNRKILNSILKEADITENQEDIILIIDKLYKIGVKGVKEELKSKKLTDKQINKIISLISIKGSNSKKLKELCKLENKEGLEEIKELLSYLKEFNTKVEFDITLARGLSYYTGTIFEVVLNNDLSLSLGGGGRYDDMISKFMDSKQEYPAVGISFGLDRIYNILVNKNIKKTNTRLFIIPIQTLKESLNISQKLRENNINTDIDLNNKGISKNLDYANKLNIPYVLFIGENELKKKKLKLKDMNSGKEKFLTIKELCKFLNG
ncbi:histidine--tRNA ligase [Candidatus Woesearchaeota archaeon]|nr:histidine--tRNA ligase [Candidatus Woesearchaeota archaeon]